MKHKAVFWLSVSNEFMHASNLSRMREASERRSAKVGSYRWVLTMLSFVGCISEPFSSVRIVMFSGR